MIRDNSQLHSTPFSVSLLAVLFPKSLIIMLFHMDSNIKVDPLFEYVVRKTTTLVVMVGKST